MIPPGMAFLSISPKAWAAAESAKLPKLYFNLKKEKKNAAGGESSWTPNTSLVLALALVVGASQSGSFKPHMDQSAIDNEKPVRSVTSFNSNASGPKHSRT